MNETLGWTGLGNCDGGSIGSGTMEVCCFVADFEVAKSVIAANLKGTEFENYTRNYNENKRRLTSRRWRRRGSRLINFELPPGAAIPITFCKKKDVRDIQHLARD